jgi:HAD superfamily hydrolase (TIGR01450 family)
MHVVFLTNNSSSRVTDYHARLAAAGIDAAPDDILTSAQAGASIVARMHRPGARVLATAGPGVVEALEARGFVVVDDGPADAVVVGWHSDFNFERLRRAADVVRSGATFVATNLDPTYPGARGLLPGAGSLAAAVATAGGRRPEVAGKPETAMAELVRKRVGQPAVVVGDRPSTDGAFAAALGCPFGLVLSGVAGSAGEEPVPEPEPAFVAADLGALAPMLVAALSCRETHGP